jgi:hypothetical protein
VLVDPAIAEPDVHRPSAISVIRCLICSAPMLSPCRRVFRIDSGGCAFVLPLWRSTCRSAAGLMPADVSAPADTDPVPELARVLGRSRAGARPGVRCALSAFRIRRPAHSPIQRARSSPARTGE